jgi:predicted metalloprotease with PDZ domain
LIRDEFIDPSRTITAGLLEFERRHAAQDRSAYPLFYSQGATFWAAIDSALRANSGGASDLDALIPGLLGMSMGPGGRLPAPFVARLRTDLGARADELLAKYVGD